MDTIRRMRASGNNTATYSNFMYDERNDLLMEFKLDRLKLPLCFFALTVFLIAVAFFMTYDESDQGDTQDQPVIIETSGPNAIG